MDERLNQLNIYVKPTNATIIGGAILGFFGLICIAISIIFYSEEFGVLNIIAGLLMIFFCVFLIYSGVSSMKRTKKLISELEAQGRIEILLNDFQTSGRAINDSLRLGQIFLFGKQTGTIIEYNNIKQIYEYIHSINGIEDSRILKVVTVSDNKTVNLCRLPLWGKAKEETMNVIGYILSKNPDIKVGFK